MKPQLMAGVGTLKILEPPQLDEIDNQNYTVCIQKDEIKGDTIVEENYPRIIRNWRVPAYLSDYVDDMYD